MKVLHVVDSVNLATGGTSQSTTALADALTSLGCETTLLAHNYIALGDIVQTRLAKQETVPARQIPFRLGAWAPGFSKKLELLAKTADLIHNHGLWLPTNRMARRAAQKKSIPYVISTRGMLEGWSLRFKNLRKSIVWNLIEKNNLSAAHCLHATSEMELQSLRMVGLRHPIAVIPNGVTAPVFLSQEESLSLFPQLKGRRVILFLSRLHPKKGIDDLLNCWQRLHTKYREWILVIAGDRENGSPDYASEVKMRGIHPFVYFSGDVRGDKKSALFNLAEIFVLPTKSENFGIAIAEALAAGVPVITTTAAPWSLLQKEKCGWWIKPEEKHLVDTLDEALSMDSRELRTMGLRGKALMEKDFTWEAAAKKMIEVYQWLVGEKNVVPKCVNL